MLDFLYFCLNFTNILDRDSFYFGGGSWEEGELILWVVGELGGGVDMVGVGGVDTVRGEGIDMLGVGGVDTMGKLSWPSISPPPE